MLKRELVELKRQFFKYKHIPFLRHNVSIEIANIRDTLKASGQYIKVEGKHELDYTHRIEIDSEIANEYINYKRNWIDYHYCGIGKKYYKERLRQLIRHEILHAFIEERYEGWFDITGTNYDASPIFLAVLYWCGGISNHECVRAFKRTELFKRLKEFHTFEELDNHICKMLIDYNKVNSKLKQGIQIDDCLMSSSFTFSQRNAGLKASYQSIDYFVSKNELPIKRLETNLFEIGCCIMPEQIEPLIKTKRFGKFEKTERSKMLYINPGTMKTIWKQASGI